ncbi:MAG: glycosyl hydrolase, partial [Bacteroidota bacterium]
MKNNIIFLICGVLFLLFAQSCKFSNDDKLKDEFRNPPDESRPGVYWYFMDGNQTREAMTTDLRAMYDAGLRKALFLEVNIGVPRGPVDFM